MTQSQIISDAVSTMRDTGKALAEITFGTDPLKAHMLIRKIQRVLEDAAERSEKAAREARRSAVDVESMN